jgi:hypothetical protein
VRVRLDRKATSIVLLVVLGVREDGHKVLLAAKNMGGETSEAWRTVLDDLVKRGLRRPETARSSRKPSNDQWLGKLSFRRCQIVATLHDHTWRRTVR